jgi:cell division protein FtsX
MDMFIIPIVAIISLIAAGIAGTLTGLLVLPFRVLYKALKPLLPMALSIGGFFKGI